MKHCDYCGKEFNARETQCPICGGALRETDDADEITALMLLLGLL